MKDIRSKVNCFALKSNRSLWKRRKDVQILFLWPKGGSHMNTGFCQEARWLSPGYGIGHLVNSFKITGRLPRWKQCGSYQNWNILDFIHGTRFTLYLCWTWSTCMLRPSVGHIPKSAWGHVPCPCCVLQLIPENYSTIAFYTQFCLQLVSIRCSQTTHGVF